ncbi:MAG TPA: LamG domain-containing protein [Candidatus Paceibacterota bacterium]|jgi:hypothetical protein
MVTRINLYILGSVVALLIAVFGLTQCAYATNTFAVDLEKDSSQYLSISDASQTGLDITSDISMEAWIKLESLPVTDTAAPIAGKSLNTGDQRGYSLYIDAPSGQANRLVFFYSDDGTGSLSFTLDAADVTLTPGNWYHVAATADVSAKDIDLYLNGDLLSDTNVFSNATSIYNNSAPFELGRRDSTNERFDGLIDDVRIWNDIRTESEIQDNMYEALTGSESNLVGYWMLNGTSTDATSNGNDLTNNNSASYVSEFPYTLSCTLPGTSFTGLNFSLDLTCELLGLFL